MAMKNPTKTYRLALIGVMTAILCILGPLSIPLPFSPVPLSLTNFAILLRCSCWDGNGAPLAVVFICCWGL